MKCRLRDMKEREDEIREAIEARLAVHRADVDQPKLGIDKLVKAHRLSGEERVILVAASLPAISGALAEQTFEPLSLSFRGISTNDLVRLLDPQGTADWVKFRHLFDSDSALVGAGLVVLDPIPHAPDTPDALWGADVRITSAAFATLTGDGQP